MEKARLGRAFFFLVFEMSLKKLLCGILVTFLPRLAGAVDLHDCSFGEVYSFAMTGCMAVISNSEDRVVQIEVAPEWQEDRIGGAVRFAIPPKGAAHVPLMVSIGNHVGRTTHFFRVIDESRSHGYNEEKTYLKASGFVMSAFSDPKPVVDLGSIRVDSKVRDPSRLTLNTMDAPNLKINRVLSAPSDIKVSLQGADVLIGARTGAAWDSVDDFVKLSVDTPRQKEVWINVKGSLHGVIAPDENPVNLGVVSSESRSAMTLTSLRDLDGGILSIDSIDVSGISAVAWPEECLPSAVSCKILRMDVSKAQEQGPFQGSLSIGFSGHKRRLTVNVRGIYSSRAAGKYDDGIKGWVPPYYSSIEHLEDARVSDSVISDISNSILGEGALLRWGVHDERAVYGYQIYRSDEEAGPYVLLNVPAIRAKTSLETDVRYQWRDITASKGRSYWYFVGVVYNDGRKERITPFMRWKGVLPP